MKKWAKSAVVFIAFATTLSSKDKGDKVSFQEMAAGMRDAFNCGVVVEQYLHGRLKGKEEAYSKERDAYKCDHVEAVLATLHDQDNTPPTE